jgi:hypothetical protein
MREMMGKGNSGSGVLGRAQHLLLIECLILLSHAVLPARESQICAQASEKTNLKDSLAIVISMPIREFRYGQDIFTEVSVINLTDDSLTILAPWHPDNLRILDEHGDDVSLNWIHVGMRRIPVQTLAPRDTLVARRPVHSYYYANKDPAKRPASYILGEHTLTAQLGDIYSNEVSYRVIEADPEDAQIIEALSMANRSWMKRNSWRAITDSLLVILRDNPNTIYKPELLSTINRFIRFIKDHQFEIDVNRRILTALPDDIVASTAMDKIISNMSSTAKATFLDSIIVKFPGTKASECAKKRRKSMGSE